MNLLLIGSGGREHAIAWKLSQSPACGELYIAPGNAGTALCGTNVPLSPNDFEALKMFCLEKDIAMVIVGPEEPLVKGIVDNFRQDEKVKQIPVIGPSAEAAQLEGSKSFAKQFMIRHGIPTAAYREFDASSYDEGIPYLQSHALPVVIKADGLAAGKGVVICQSREEAVREYELMLQQNKFGDAGKKLVVEEFLDGIEMSVFVLSDGKNYVVLPEAKDYKRIGEGDTGLNTGGMGAVSPVPFADDDFMRKVRELVIEPTMQGLKKDGIEYVGFVFFGLIRVNNEPMVIEYNCRMGDPETEVVIPRLKNDLVDLFVATANGKLAGVTIETNPEVACTVMAVSGGYPNAYIKGLPISGTDEETQGALIFHAGTNTKDGQVFTDGGRVICVTAFGESIDAAVVAAVKKLEHIRFEGMYFREGIGWEFR